MTTPVTPPLISELRDLARLPPIATHFYTTHTFWQVIEFLQKFPHTSCDKHPSESILCGVTWDKNNTWARYVISMTTTNSTCIIDKKEISNGDALTKTTTHLTAYSGPGLFHGGASIPGPLRSSPNLSTEVDALKLLEFNHTYGKSDVWITLFHNLRREFSVSSSQLLPDDARYDFKELECWPADYKDSPPNGEFFTMILGLCHDAFLESYTLGATYLADYVKKYNRQQLLQKQIEIESAAIQLVKTDHPQCIRCAAEIAKILQLSQLNDVLKKWTPPAHFYFDQLMWTDPIRQVAKAVQQDTNENSQSSKIIQ